MLNNKYATVTYVDDIIVGDDIDNTLHDNNQLGNLEITGTGDLVIKNTGGSSASEGGMGTGGGTEQGPGIQNPGEKDSSTGGPSTSGTSEEKEEGWDPLKPKEEKEKGK